MAWVYLQASFRGVPFHVREHGAEGGRRLHIHEYPGSDDPSFPEDLGRRTRRFEVEAYVVGDDYQEQRDRLITACETKGAGALVHPYLGELQVKCETYKLSERTSEGGKAGLSLMFVEAARNTFPTRSIDSASAVSTAADAARLASARRFARDFAFPSTPASFVSEELGEATTRVADGLASIFRPGAIADHVLGAIGDEAGPQVERIARQGLAAFVR